MREVSIRIYDDLDYARDKTRNEATVSVLVGLDGMWAELDLGEANMEKVRQTLQRWMSAGHSPETPPPARRSGRRPGPQGKIPPESLARGKAIRAFAAVRGFSTTTANGSGKTYYSDPLKRAFERAVREFALGTGLESDSVELYTAFREHLGSVKGEPSGEYRRAAVQEDRAGTGSGPGDGA